MPSLTVRFKDNRNYPIVVEPGAIRSIGPLVKSRVRGKNAFIITHPRIKRLYGQAVEQSLKKAGLKVITYTVPEGEETKSLQHAEAVISKMIRDHADRKAFIVALGGGVVGDLAGFIASIYMRGIDFVQVPTTLLAQVDSSVGGKVAVNHPLGKNMIGAFLQPKAVIADPEVLKTLAKRQLKSGLAEIIKAAIIADAGFFTALEKKMNKLLALEMETLAWAIKKSCRIKATVVEKDERESGIRAILNYGHTFGHALETFHHYRKYLHGEAVAIGMAAAALYAAELKIMSQQDAERQIALIKHAGLPIKGSKENIDRIIVLMKADKKASAGEINFILTPKIGHARICKKNTPFSVRRVLNAVL